MTYSLFGLFDPGLDLRDVPLGLIVNESLDIAFAYDGEILLGREFALAKTLPCDARRHLLSHGLP
jgi:hypothetical protein